MIFNYWEMKRNMFETVKNHSDVTKQYVKWLVFMKNYTNCYVFIPIFHWHFIVIYIYIYVIILKSILQYFWILLIKIASSMRVFKSELWFWFKSLFIYKKEKIVLENKCLVWMIFVQDLNLDVMF